MKKQCVVALMQAAGLVLDRNNAPYIIYVVHQFIIRYKNKDVLDAAMSLRRRCSLVYKGENCYIT